MTHKLDPVLDAGLCPEATFKSQNGEKWGYMIPSSTKANQNVSLKPMRTALSPIDAHERGRR